MRFVTPILLTLLLIASGNAIAGQNGPLYIFGGDGHKEFLGCLNCGETHPKSVWNDMSKFGFKNDFGVWNPFGQFANPFSNLSMCNQFASDPPIIVDEEGYAYGRMSINEFVNDSVCGATGNERACRVAKSICAGKD